jgi:hypothetical protein
MVYVKQPWVNNTTPVDDVHMLHIEDGLGIADANASTALAQSLPQPVVNGQWVKGVGGAAVWSAIAVADLPTGIPAANLSSYPNDASKHLRGNGAWGGGLEVIDDLIVSGSVLASYDTNTRLGGNIPAIYKDLILAIKGKSDVNGNLQMRFNNVSTANYYVQLLESVGAASTASEILTAAQFTVGNSFGPGTGLSNFAEITVPNYLDTTFPPGYRADYWFSTNNNTGTLRKGSSGGALSGGGAVIRIQAFLSGANFAIGTRFTLYGRG